MNNQAKFILIYLPCWLLVSIISIIAFSHSDPELMAHCLWATIIYAAIQSLGWILIIYTTRKIGKYRSVIRFVIGIIYLNLIVFFVNVDPVGLMPEINSSPLDISKSRVIIYIAIIHLFYIVSFLIATYFTFGMRKKIKSTQ